MAQLVKSLYLHLFTMICCCKDESASSYATESRAG